LLWRIPLAVAIVFGSIFYFVSVNNEFFIVAGLVLAAFNVIVAGIITKNNSQYYKDKFGINSYHFMVSGTFLVGLILGLVGAVFFALPAFKSPLWVIIFISTTSYAVLVLFTLFYFIFAFDKRK
jgi:hypothetical protein